MGIIGRFGYYSSLDIIYMDTNSQRTVLKGSPNASLSNTAPFTDFIDTSSTCLSKELHPFSKPHSAAFLDLNGDCLSDLFFTSASGSKKYHELWLRTGPAKYCLSFYDAVDSDASQVAFAGFSRDGRIDFMYAIKNKLYLQRNRLSAPVIDGDDCVAAGFKDVFTTAEEIPFGASKEVTELREDDVYAQTIRVGDYNLDGYADLLFTWKTKGGAATYLCESDSGLNYNTCELLSSTARVAAFFDIDEDGKPDILLVEKEGETHYIKGYYQYFNRDAFILKVMQLQDTSYGGIYYGTEFTYIYTDLDGSRHAGIGVQAPQNAYSALQMPYGLVGIGRSSNYIEHLSISYPVNVNPNNRVWSPIIPNSQVIIKSGMTNSKK
eukprot:TRINITY_DN1710_c0_g1_i3.p1 TRINITY_DN1710_c0_g1~~TRINITY_DN1710_c0_g1_i3.p1  ORF type:complete len:379 (+),score=88.74 TRINITY_DN1710_c0_g1_i3:753-1889(+)